MCQNTKSFELVRRQNPVVYAYMERQAHDPEMTMESALQQCISALVNQNNNLMAEVMKLSAIAPTKWSGHDGKIYVYRAPAELLKLSNPV